jgi:hypothetical protein
MNSKVLGKMLKKLSVIGLLISIFNVISIYFIVKLLFFSN